MKTFSLRVAYSAVVICALVPRPAIKAQTATTGGSGSGAATAWMTSTNYLGIENFRCDCTLSFNSATSARRFVFRSEPVVLGVRFRSPSYGILQRGDVITHVDGESITTAEGGRRFASIEPGDDVNLTIRRNGRIMKVALHASEAPSTSYVATPEAAGGYSISWESPGAVAVAPVPPVAAVAPRVWSGYTPTPAMPAMPAIPPVVSVPTPAPTAYGAAIAALPSAPVLPSVPAMPAMPLGWFGFSIRCNGCGWSTSGPDADPVWESEQIPELSRVEEDSPAGRAGLRAGDRITHIDGFSILSRQGARRFGSVRPRQQVRLRVLRDGTSIERTLTLGTRPETRAVIASGITRPGFPRASIAPVARRPLRYTGQIDNVSVEVWSAAGPTVDKVGDTIVITVGTSVVRIKVDPRK